MQDYTPKNINEIVFESSAEKEMVQKIASGAIAIPHNGISGIILYGMPGTGKTALAGILIRAIENSRLNNTSNPNISTYHCTSPNNGTAFVESLRTQLSMVSMNASGLHYIVLHEADNLTGTALVQLKSTMEIPGAVFVLTTNNIHKFERPLLDRCIQVSFNPTDPAIWIPRLRTVLANEGKNGFTDEFLASIAKNANFSARQIFVQLQRLP